MKKRGPCVKSNLLFQSFRAAWNDDWHLNLIERTSALIERRSRILVKLFWAIDLSTGN